MIFKDTTVASRAEFTSYYGQLPVTIFVVADKVGKDN